MKLTLKIWRQANQDAKGAMHTYELDEVSEDMSFLEMLDVLNEKLNADGEEPIAFDSDCREGICGMCSLMINGEAHGPEVTTTCQLHMRSFNDGETITIEPWRAQAFPVIKDLVVDRSAFDRIIQMGGFISVNTGAAPDAATMPSAQGQGRSLLRHGHLHRLWRMCGGLPEWLSFTLPRRQDHPLGRIAPRPGRAQ
ncbi:MAG: succinate dehydrogenase/fumarate reductase iron-sulfur subunit [Marmoricola sp.]